MIEQFMSYVRPLEQELEDIDAMVSVPLSDNIAQLEDQVKRIASHYGRLTTILADAESYLDLAQREYLRPKGTGTDLDRTTQQVADCALFRKFRNRVQGLTKTVEMLVSLGQSILKFNAAERRMPAV